MEWVRGDEIGHGAFATIYLAKPRNVTNGSRFLPPCVAVKSCLAQDSFSLKNEKEVLTQLGDCPEIVRCFGDDTSFENGDEFYNVFLEFAASGSLANYLKKQRGVGERVSEFDVRRYTRSILKGIHHIHSKGYVHCDIKLHNILVNNGCDDIKICDFGLAKKAGPIVPRRDETAGCEIRGTPVYMAPESFNENEYEAPCDIWALGCAVVEMFTGKPAWEIPRNGNVFGLMMKISMGDELPEFPAELSAEGRDFLMKCFVKDPEKRWTAKRLLNHPFVANDTDIIVKEDREWFVSPRCPFNFMEWDSLDSSLKSSVFNEERKDSITRSSEEEEEEEEIDSILSRSCYYGYPTPSDRIMSLVGDGAQTQLPNWDACESWMCVRQMKF